MASQASTNLGSTTTACHHQHPCDCQQSESSLLLSRGNTSPFIALDNKDVSQGSIFAKPFDRWTPIGGGAESDIFRRFKIQKSEEEDFLLHWARQRLTSGIVSRDDDCTLVFRVSSKDISELVELGIGRSDSHLGSGVQWIHVYDKEGISWLTQFRCVDIENFQSIYDTNGQPIRASGRIGRYGPSGLTPKDFYLRTLTDKDLEHAREIV